MNLCCLRYMTMDCRVFWYCTEAEYYWTCELMLTARNYLLLNKRKKKELKEKKKKKEAWRISLKNQPDRNYIRSYCDTRNGMLHAGSWSVGRPIRNRNFPTLTQARAIEFRNCTLHWSPPVCASARSKAQYRFQRCGLILRRYRVFLRDFRVPQIILSKNTLKLSSGASFCARNQYSPSLTNWKGKVNVLYIYVRRPLENPS